MKHLATDYHFVCDLVQLSELCVVHVSVGDQLANALTNSLSTPSLFYLCSKICVISGTPSRGGVLEYFSVFFYWVYAFTTLFFLGIYVTTQPNHVDIIRFGPKEPSRL